MNKEKQPEIPVVASLPDEPQHIVDAISKGFLVTINQPLVYEDGRIGFTSLTLSAKNYGPID
jgi:hypothetical protein